MKFGKPSDAELNMTVYAPDPEADAVVLYKSTDVHYDVSSGSFKTVTTVKCRIKILKEDGKEYANVEVPYYEMENANANKEIISGVKATAYNMEGGKVVKTKMENSAIFKERIDPSYMLLKFTVPQVKTGTVIEYQYTSESEFYYTTLSTDSRGIYKLPTTSLTALKDDFLPTPVKIAEKLSAGEREQAKDGVFSISEPEHYNRMEHAIRIHSWAPVYVDYDPVEDLSFETKQFASSFGATAMFQNDLSTVTGNVGVSLISMYDDILDYYREGYDGEIPGDPGHIDSAVFKPSIHAQVAFSGLPVRVLFRADIGERNAYRDRYQTNEGAIYCIREAGSKPLVKLTSQFYVPFDLSRRGWQRGLIPSYKFTYTNDEMADMRYSWGSASPGYRSGCFRGIASLRFYNMLPVTSSGIFPRWGIGLEAGNVKTNNEQLHLYPSGKFSCDNQNYAMAYAYLPGFMRTHGFSIQGYISKSYGSKIVERTRSYVNAEYAMPFAPVDWSFLGPVAYIRNFEFRAHYYAAWDNVRFKQTKECQNDLTQRVGISLLARLGNFFWLPFDTRVGVRLMKGIGGSSSYSEFVFTTDL